MSTASATIPMDPAMLMEAARRVLPDVYAQWASDGAFVPYIYQRYFLRRIAAAIARGRGRIIINVPSRHGKSIACSKWLPTWFIDNLPGKTVVLASYGAELAENFGRQVRNEFANNPRLMTRLREDSAAAGRWNTPQGGGMLSVGVDGGVLGRGYDLAICDDLHKGWNEAQLPTWRKRVIEWFGTTFYSRGEPNSTIVVLMQRFHPEDIAGWLIEHHADNWEVISMPAIAEEGDLLGRMPGEPLCPQRYDLQALLGIKGAMAPGAWEAMFQQCPVDRKGGLAYPNFDQAGNTDKDLRLRLDLPLQLAFDFNVNPGMHCLIGQYDTRTDLFTICHEVHGPRLKTPALLDMAEKIIVSATGKPAEKLGEAFAEIQIYGDRSGRTEGTQTTVTDYHLIVDRIRKWGAQPVLRVPSANPPVRDRLMTVNDALRDGSGERHAKINPLACPRLIADLKRVKEDEKGLIDKKTDDDLTHASDAFGYQIYAQRRIHRIERMAHDSSPVDSIADQRAPGIYHDAPTQGVR